MQPVTENFKSVVNAAVRNLEVVVKLIGKNETDYTNARIYSSKDMLLSLKIVDGQTTGSFGLGGTICPSLTAELHKTAVVAVGDKVKVELIVYNGGGNLTMASEFTVDNMRRKGDGTLLVVALGNMVKLSKNYVSQLTYPTTQLAVLEEIAEQTGYELHPLITTELINDPVIQTAPVKGKAEDGSPLYYTRREMLGYAAAINGGAAFIDQYGRIALARHNDTGEAFTHERVLQETISEPFEIAAVKWNSSGLSYALGDDYDENTVEFYNPLNYSARELIAHNLETDLIGFGYDGAIIKKQGCGYLEVGDIVHYTDIGGTVHKLLILGIVYEFVGGYFSETLYSLTSTATQREYAGNEVVSNQIGGGQATQETTTPLQPLTSYNAYSDTKIKCNDIWYTASRNSDGFITKISDDIGNSVNIECPATSPDDIPLHNAIAWAVAMSRGLGSAYALMPHRYGVQWYYDVNYLDGIDEWKNIVNPEAPLTLIGATQNSDGSVRLGCTETSYGSLELGDSMGDSVTMYVVAKCEAMGGETDWTVIAQLANAYDGSSAAEFNELGIEGHNEPNNSSVGITVSTQAYGGRIYPSPRISPYKYNVMVVRTNRASNQYSFFVNGAKVGTSSSNSFLPTLTLGACMRAGVRYFGGNPCNYRMLAVSKAEHSDAEVISNCYWLMSRFGVTG